MPTLDHTSPGKGHRLFSWQLCLDRTALDQKKHLVSSVVIQFLPAKVGSWGVGVEGLESLEGKEFSSLLVGPRTFYLECWAQASLAVCISHFLDVSAVNIRQQSQGISP